ncbi:DegV domain-containing protein [Candidatus Izimaplasma bacterium HR1]|uniref:DegV family protein n=1 Tax=Candidatus Izimoplasma sp. HR1 TaxID=1541959 RepID=UPI0004F88751|nr:DegV domain-containing protein [Candidatus Izimaplasma bacterium HR1]
MENKIAVIACSNACLDYMDHKYDIKIFRSTLHLGDEDYLDYVDISAEDFYKRLELDKSVFPSSSYMPIGQMIEIYEELVKEGYNKALVISISGEMSGIVNSSKMAANEVEGLEVTVYDSKTLAYPEAKMALKACEMIENGKDIPEIIEELDFIKDNHQIYFAVNTLTYLVKNGRIGNASGFIGNALHIKPILTISKDGKVETVEKIRTFKKAVEGLIAKYFEETKGKNVEAYIIHANNPSAKDHIAEVLLKDNPDLEIFDMPLTAVVGAHAGPKTIGLGYLVKK